MIQSLSGVTEASSCEADVHLIGAGIAGLLLATTLANRGLRVVVTESGAERQVADTHPLNEVVQVATPYSGAGAGRFRCLGGTSTRWGGAMIPFQAHDLTYGAWPVGLAEVETYIPEVERIFGLPHGPYDSPNILDGELEAERSAFVSRLAKWPAFDKRNVATLFREQLRSPSGPQVWLNATVTAFSLSDNGRLEHTLARSPAGGTITVRARETVITAGAIESTRLLLLLDRFADGRAFGTHDVLGRFFHDHLSSKVAVLEQQDRNALNRVAGFRFEGSGMRNLRFEPRELPSTCRELVPSFAHIGFTSPPGGGFDVLRDVLRNIQQRRPPSLDILVRLLRTSPWLAKALWWRLKEQRLLYPEGAEIDLHMVIEQEPRRENRITLSADRNDMFGTPLAAIDWRVNGDDEARLTCCTDAFLRAWEGSDLARLAQIRRRPVGIAEAELSQGGGIYHPGGSTRMASHPHEGVLDTDLRTHAISNLSVAATSAFPTGGGANPTMMLMLFALRMADRLYRGKVGT